MFDSACVVDFGQSCAGSSCLPVYFVLPRMSPDPARLYPPEGTLTGPWFCVACPSSDININRLFVVVLVYSAFAILTEFAFSQHTYTVDFQALCESIELQILHVWKLSMPIFLGTNRWGLNLWDSMGTPAVMASVLVLWLSEEDTWATIWLYSYSVFSDSTSTNNSNYNSNSLNLNQVQHGTTNSTTCWCVLYRFDSFRSF